VFNFLSLSCSTIRDLPVVDQPEADDSSLYGIFSTNCCPQVVILSKTNQQKDPQFYPYKTLFVSNEGLDASPALIFALL
jgi:hypothetical protein